MVGQNKVKLYKKNNIIVFSVLLIVYIGFIFVSHPHNTSGDEPRYIMFAENITQGYYSETDPGKIHLWNGPGYPFVLAPFAALDIPVIFMRLLNAVFIAGGALFLFLSMRLYDIPEKTALAVSVVFSFFPTIIDYSKYINTESFIVFLMSLMLFLFLVLMRRKALHLGLLFLVSFVLMWGAMTKVLFGYAIFAMIGFSLAVWLIRRNTKTMRAFLVFLVAGIMCLPWLAYTHSLTGKTFYWSDAGGLQLYWMTSPINHNLGDWHYPIYESDDQELDVAIPAINGMENLQNKTYWGNLFNYNLPSDADIRDLIGVLKKYNSLEPIKRDDFIRAKAIENLKKNPRQYVKSCIANAGRLFFNYPYTYTNQSLYQFKYFFPNIILFGIMLASLYFGWRSRKKLGYEFFVILMFSVVSLGGMVLISAYHRMLLPLLPLMVFWSTFIYSKVIEIKVSY